MRHVQACDPYTGQKRALVRPGAAADCCYPALAAQVSSEWPSWELQHLQAAQQDKLLLRNISHSCTKCRSQATAYVPHETIWDLQHDTRSAVADYEQAASHACCLTALRSYQPKERLSFCFTATALRNSSAGRLQRKSAAGRTLARPARTAAPTGRAGPPPSTGASASALGQRLRAAGGHRLLHAPSKCYRDARAPLRAAARCLQLPCPAAQPRATCCGNRLLQQKRSSQYPLHSVNASSLSLLCASLPMLRHLSC